MSLPGQRRGALVERVAPVRLPGHGCAAAREPRIPNLDPPPHLKGAPQAELLKYVGELNRDHLASHPGELDLEARIASYELAAKMQTAAKEALDLSKRNEQDEGDVRPRRPGNRRLRHPVPHPRGGWSSAAVRFVQVFTSNQQWDNHGSIRSSLPAACKSDRQALRGGAGRRPEASGACSTARWWRGAARWADSPVIQNDAGSARRSAATTTLTASRGGSPAAGFARPASYGATDEFGHHAVEKPVSQHDFHTTILHLFGLDAKKLTYKRSGRRPVAARRSGGEKSSRSCCGSTAQIALVNRK